MNNSSIFAAQFAAASLNSLVASFNHEVGNHGWCSARASYDHALIAEFLAQWKFSGDKHKSLQVYTERTFHQRYLLVML